MKNIYFAILLISFIFIEISFSQEIQLRTVPLAAGNQVAFYPSLSRGMGNLSISFEDSLADPLVNPAKAHKLVGVNLFFSPTRNTWGNEGDRAVFTSSGSAKYKGTSINSVPFGFYLKKDNFFSGGIITYQSYTSERSIPDDWLNNNNTKNDIGNNIYAFGLIGVYIPTLNLSIGGSVSWSEYKAIDGVNLLYPGSYDIDQYGRAFNFKLGFAGNFSEQISWNLSFQEAHLSHLTMLLMDHFTGWRGIIGSVYTGTK